MRLHLYSIKWSRIRNRRTGAALINAACIVKRRIEEALGMGRVFDSATEIRRSSPRLFVFENPLP
jgi:hypothetical protein